MLRYICCICIVVFLKNNWCKLNYFIMILLTLVCTLFGFFLWLKVSHSYKTPINHVNFFSLSWLTVLLGSIIFPLDVRILPYTYLILICAWIFFLLGSLILSTTTDVVEVESFEYNYKRIKIVLYFLVIFSFLAYLFSLGDIISNVSNLEAWASIRGERVFADATSENIFYTLFARNYGLYIPIAFFLFVKKEINKKVLTIIVIYGVITSVINFSRAPLLELIIISFVSLMLIKDSKKIPIFWILFVISGFVLLFIFSQSLLFSLNDYSVFDANYQIKMYLFGSISNYQLILDGLYPDNLTYSSPFYSLDFINYILKRLDIIYSYPDQIREFNDYIDGSNVYTFLDAFTLDFGVFGAFLGSFILGYFSKRIYLQYIQTRTIQSLIVYSLLCYFSIMAYINNEYIRFAFLLFILKATFVEYIIRMRLKTKNSID